jgi:hypothetical protein
VTLCKEGLPERTVWLVIKRTVGADPSYAYAISNAPVRTPWYTLAWLKWSALGRGTMLRRRQNGVGMDHYEVRKYPGWHHHMLTTMLAHFFLWHLKRCWGKKSPRADDVATANNVQKARKKKIRGTWLALGAIVINVAVLVLGAAE